MSRLFPLLPPALAVRGGPPAAAAPPPSGPVVVSAWIVKSGTLIAFGVTSSTPATTPGAAPAPAPIAAVDFAPTVYRNGRGIAIGPPTWWSSTQELPIVFFRLHCGRVRTIAVSSTAAGSGYTAPTVTWNGDGGGSSLVLGPPILAAGAIRWVPIVASSNDFTARPTFTVTDATGSGADLYAIMDGVQPVDTITYQAPADWCRPILGGGPQGIHWGGGTVQPVTAATLAPVDNWAGQLEGASGAFGCFAQVPTLIPGMNIGSQPADPSNVSQTCKNRAMIGGWAIAGGGVLTTDAGGNPVSWTQPAASTLRSWVHGTMGSFNGVSWPSQAGQWTLVYTDPGLGTAAALDVSLGARYPVTQVGRTTAGTTVTAIYAITYPAGAPSWELDVAIYVRAGATGDGLGHWTISGLKAVPPDHRDGTAQPVVPGESDDLPDPNLTRALRGLGVSRWVDATAGYMAGPDANYIDPADFPWEPPGSWNRQKKWDLRFVAARYFNTDPASPVYPWSCTELTGPQALFQPPIPLPPGDDGFSLGSSQSLVVELRGAAPHGLSTGMMMNVWVEAGGVAVPIRGTTLRFTPAASGGTIYVTGPDTIALGIYAPNLVPASDQPMRIGATAEVDLTAGGTLPGWLVYGQGPAHSCPYRATAAAAAAWPGSAVWVGLPVNGSDATFARIAADVAAELGPSNLVFLELGNEVWNGTSSSLSLLGAWGRLLQNIAAGVTILGGRYTGTGARPAWGLNYEAYVPIAAHAFDVFTAAAGPLGIAATRIRRVYGSFQAGAIFTQFLINQCTATGTPVDHIAIAPYWTPPADPTVLAAFEPYGTAATSEAWPVDAINDFVRHSFAYSPVWMGRWSAHAQFILGSTLEPRPTLIQYEGGFQQITQSGQAQANQIAMDCMAHPSARDLLWGYYAASQQGDPTVPGSGASHANWYQAFCPPPTWFIAAGLALPPGPGRNNQFQTYQGGYPADHRDHSGGGPGVGNEAPGLQGVIDWAAAVAKAGG